MNRREAALENQLEILDPRLESLREPGHERILVRHPSDPVRLDPFFQGVRRAGQRVDPTVGPAPLRRGRIEVGDDLCVWVNGLELPDERERRVDVVFRVLRVAQHERKLRDDSVGSCLLRNRHGLRSREPLRHLPESLV